MVVMREAWLFDMDGTLCDVSSIRHFVRGGVANRNFDRFHNDSAGCPPNPQALALYNEAGQRGIARIVTTSRQACYYNATIWFFLLNGIPVPDDMFMRRINDTRPDRIVKAEMFDNVIQHRYNVTLAVDDRPDIIAVWQARNIETVRIPGWEEE